MNIVINESNNLMNQQKIDNLKKENGATSTIKNKLKKLKSSNISNYNIYKLCSPNRKNTKKINHTKNLLKQSLKTKYSITNKKEKDERDINKMNTINSIRNLQNERSKQNIWWGSISPKIIRKFKIDDNDDKENNIINLFKMTDKLYTNDEHFQKDPIKKNKTINKNCSSNIMNRNFLMSGRNNSLCQKKKLIITFGLNEDKNKTNINLKDSFAENSQKNFYFKRKISAVNKGIYSELNKSKEKSNFSYYLKFKQKFRLPSKEINDEPNGNNNSNNNHKNENHKINVLHNCYINNGKNYTKRNSQFFRARSCRTAKNIESPKKIKEEEKEKEKEIEREKEKEKEKEETYSKSKKSNNIKKVNSKKSNNIKIKINNNNKTQIPNDVVEIPKKESQNKQTNNLKRKFCFLCCLTNKLDDSEDL